MTKTDETLERINKFRKYVDKDDLIIAKDIKVKKVSTGSIGIDKALNGGFPLGQIVTLFGPYDSAKSTIALTTVANAQKEGMHCIYINSEGSFNPEWAKKNGVDTDTLVIWDVNSFEEIENGIRGILNDSIFHVVVLDSITAVSTEKDFEESGDNRLGILAAGMSKMLRKISAWQNRNCLIILISQLRMKTMGQVWVGSWSGGNAVDHYSSIIIRMNRGGKEDITKDTLLMGNLDKSVDIVTGFKVTWELVKSKVSTKKALGSFYCKTQGGIDNIGEIIELGINYGVIEKAGSWFKYGGNSYHGTQDLNKAMQEDDKLLERIANEIT